MRPGKWPGQGCLPFHTQRKQERVNLLRLYRIVAIKIAEFVRKRLRAPAEKAIVNAMSDVTRILSAIDQGDPHAADQLLPLVYTELRELAAQKLAHETPGQTLEPTALVHEAYLRLTGEERKHQWESRGHFFAAAAEAMRRILVENARRKQADKHGGGRRRVPLAEFHRITESPQDLLDLDEALTRLAGEDPNKAQVVQLRFFAGLSGREAADALGVSLATAERWWAYARAWLFSELQGDREASSPP
jgi:RNA polymerase sigma factor (TIGR02999 family)